MNPHQSLHLQHDPPRRMRRPHPHRRLHLPQGRSSSLSFTPCHPPPSPIHSMAELACGLLCSCLPFLPRLYQHVSAIAPYTAHHGSSAQALQDPETKASVSHAARRGLSKSNKRGGDWIHLDDKTLASLPKGTTVDIERRGGDEQAFDEAVEGLNGGLEKGRG
jgi:hypothetical protein